MMMWLSFVRLTLLIRIIIDPILAFITDFQVGCDPTIEHKMAFSPSKCLNACFGLTVAGKSLYNFILESLLKVVKGTKRAALARVLAENTQDATHRASLFRLSDTSYSPLRGGSASQSHLELESGIPSEFLVYLFCLLVDCLFVNNNNNNKPTCRTSQPQSATQTTRRKTQSERSVEPARAQSKQSRESTSTDMGE